MSETYYEEEETKDPVNPEEAPQDPLAHALAKVEDEFGTGNSDVPGALEAHEEIAEELAD